MNSAQINQEIAPLLMEITAINIKDFVLIKLLFTPVYDCLRWRLAANPVLVQSHK